MAKVVEIAGSPHIFILKNGETFRINSRQTKPVRNDLVSDDIRNAVKMGLVMVLPDNGGAPKNGKEG